VRNFFRALLLCFIPTLALAAVPSIVPSVATLRAGNFGSYPNISLTGWYAGSSIGGGNLLYVAGDANADDGCMTFIDAASHHFRRQLNGTLLSTNMCGVKADGSTNNTVRMQAWSDAATTYNLGTVACSSNTGNINMASVINLGLGVTYRGDGKDLSPIGVAGQPGGCRIVYTGVSGGPFTLQTAVTASCPSQQAPSFYNMSISLTNSLSGTAIKLNNPATAGYVDACNGGSQGQSVLSGGVMSGVVFFCNQRGVNGGSFSKVFNYAVRDNYISFCDTQFQFDGSDNIDFQHNTLTAATVQSLNLVGHGTFGNMFHAHQNTFNDIFTNASYAINSSYGQIIVEDNYFEEATGTGTLSAINLVGGLDVTIINNGMYILSTSMPYWLTTTGVQEHLRLDNNWDGGGSAPARFNSGSGMPFMYNSAIQATIEGGKNPLGNSGIPYFTNFDTSGNLYRSITNVPAVAGSVLASVNPTTPQTPTGTFATSVYVQDGCFRVNALAGTASEFKFAVRPVVSSIIDVWVYAYSPAANTGQLISLSTDDGASYTTQAVTNTLAWYKVINNVAVNNPTLGIKNSDLAHTSLEVDVCNVVYVLH
jgi:hypothetical protein